MKSKKNRRGLTVRVIAILLLGALAVAHPRIRDAMGGLREKTEKRRSGEWISIGDTSVYAADDAYRLFGYTQFAWYEDKQVGEYTYDADGYLTHCMTWEYDAAGNLICEREGNCYEDLTAGTNRSVFAYDSKNRVTYEKRYEWGVVAEERFYRYVPEGCTCVRYVYQIGTHGDWSLAYKEAILYNENGDELCRMEYDRNEEVYHTQFSLYDDAGRLICQTGYGNGQTWTYRSEWTAMGDHIWEGTTYHSQAKKQIGVYLYDSQAIRQTERYRYDPDTGEKRLLLRQGDFQDGRPRDVYAASYDGDLLLWEICCESGKLEYFTAVSYDENGAVSEERACVRDANAGYLRILRRFVYDGAGRAAAMYEYDDQNAVLQGGFGRNGENGYGEVVFDGERGTPSRITLYNTAGILLQQFAFDRDGKWIADDGIGIREGAGMREAGAYENKRGSEQYGNNRD